MWKQIDESWVIPSGHDGTLSSRRNCRKIPLLLSSHLAVTREFQKNKRHLNSPKPILCNQKLVLFILMRSFCKLTEELMNNRFRLCYVSKRMPTRGSLSQGWRWWPLTFSAGGYGKVLLRKVRAEAFWILELVQKRGCHLERRGGRGRCIRNPPGESVPPLREGFRAKGHVIQENI